MKRDWEVIRAILVAVEEMPNHDRELHAHEVHGYDEALVAYNMWLLAEAGMIEGGGREPSAMGPPDYFVQHLQWGGHDLLDAIRKDTVWNKVKSTAGEAGVDLTISVMKALAESVTKGMLRTVMPDLPP